MHEQKLNCPKGQLSDSIDEIHTIQTKLKGSDRLCKVVELSMQCCGKLLSDSFEKY